MNIKYYFAYGPYINISETEKALPGHRLITIAKAANTRLVFVQSPHNLQTGHNHLSDRADAFGYEVWGLVCELPDETNDKLDGYQGYEKTSMTVQGVDGKYYDCFSIRVKQPGSPMKIPGWKLQMIKEGAKTRGFPQSYIEQLEKTFAEAADLESEPERPK